MKRTLVASLSMFLLGLGLVQTAASAQSVTVSWPLTSNTAATSTSSSLATGTPETISGGSGYTLSVFDYWSGQAQRLRAGTTGWLAGPVSPTRYLQFDASPTAGHQLAVTSVALNYGGANRSNQVHADVRYSTNNWGSSTSLGTALLYQPNTMTSFSAPVSGVTIPSGGTFSLRIYPYATSPSVPAIPTFAAHAGVKINGTSTSSTTTSTITIVKVAQPSSSQNFSFYAFGPNSSCCMPVQLSGLNTTPTNQKTWTLTPGSYSWEEDFNNPVPVTGWTLQSISCLPAGSATVNLANHSFTANLTSGAHITCTYTNTHASPTPDVSATKSCVVNGPQSVLCTITVTNNGTTATTSPMHISDNVTGAPSNATLTGGGGTLGASCTPGAGPITPISCNATTPLQPGSGNSKTVTFSFHLPTGGTMTNCATVTTPQPDPNPGNNTNICSTVTVPSSTGTITIVKVAQPSSSQNFSFYAFGPNSSCCMPVQLSGLNTAPTDQKTWTLAPGSYSWEEDFNNPVPVTGWTLQSISCLPAGSATVNLANHSFTANLTSGANITCTYTNTHTPPPPDVSATKSCVVNGPQSVLCTITVTNNGTTATQSPMHISDNVTGAPANATLTGGGGTLGTSCTPGAGPITPISCNATTPLQPGSANSKTATFSFHLPTGGTMTNCATVTTPQTDPNPGNNTNICSTVTVPPPTGGTVNFKITKQFMGPAVPGTYTVHISCSGGSGAYTGPSTVSLVVPPNPSAAASINVPVGATCQFTENQHSGWQPPLWGGSGQPINPNLTWGATVGPFHSTTSGSDQMQVTNQP